MTMRPHLKAQSCRYCVKQHEEYCATRCWIRISTNIEFLEIVSRSVPFELSRDLQFWGLSQIEASHARLSREH